MGAPKNYSTRSLTKADQPEIEAVLAANPTWKLKHARENVARKKYLRRCGLLGQAVLNGDVHKAAARRDEHLARIAHQHLGIETLETRNSDSLDFYDLGVWGIRAALNAAYDAGLRAHIISGAAAR